jgi:hypothetical protein
LTSGEPHFAEIFILRESKPFLQGCHANNHSTRCTKAMSSTGERATWWCRRWRSFETLTICVVELPRICPPSRQIFKIGF